LEFFESARSRRNTIEHPWLPAFVPFASLRGKHVLEIGFGPGYDALTFLQNGALYTGIDITPENVERTKQHLAFFGLVPDVREGDAEHLEFADDSFDAIYSNGVLHHVPDIQRAFREVRRVLKPGGSFYVILYNRNSLFYRVSTPISGLLRGRSPQAQLQRAEDNTAGETPLVNVYSRRELRTLLGAAGFSVTWIGVRKLEHDELPGAGGPLARLYRLVPAGALMRLGNLVGWYVVAHARKLG
jgi:SAM-dependent methyltransferase